MSVETVGAKARRALPETALRGSGLVAARVGWAAVTLLALVVSLVGFSLLGEQGVSGIVSARGLVAVPAQVIDTLHDLGISSVIIVRFFLGFRIVGMLAFAVTAIVIFLLKSDDRMTLLVSGMLIVLGAALFAPLEAAIRGNPALESLVTLVGMAGPPWVEFGRSLAALMLLLVMFVIPDGRFVPPWTKWVAVAVGAVALLWTLLPQSPMAVSRWPFPLQALWIVGVPATGVFAQLYRYAEVSDAEQRRKTRLVVFALTAASVALFLLTIFSPELGGGLFGLGLVTPEVAAVYELLLLVVLGAALLLFPLSIAFSVLRYRLWDVEVLINRALVYGLLTGLIAVMGLLAVVVLGTILGTLLGAVVAAEAALVGSTVLLTLMFQPARRRVQAVVDRAFYRHKYDAVRTIERFAAQLRHQVDLDGLAVDLLATIRNTMQPSHAGLWLRSDDEESGLHLFLRD